MHCRRRSGSGKEAEGEQTRKSFVVHVDFPSTGDAEAGQVAPFAGSFAMAAVDLKEIMRGVSRHYSLATGMVENSYKLNERLGPNRIPTRDLRRGHGTPGLSPAPSGRSFGKDAHFTQRWANKTIYTQ
jgi:hypothetical protein